MTFLQDALYFAADTVPVWSRLAALAIVLLLIGLVVYVAHD